MTSSPASPEIVSAPVPPSMMSAPPPPARVSSPGPPRSALGPSSPVTVSPVRLPSTFSIWVTRAVPVLTRSMPAGASWPRTSPAGRPSVWTSAYMSPLRSASSSAAVGLNGPAMRSKAVVCGCWRSNATAPVVPGAAGPWTWAPLASEPMPATAMSTESWPAGREHGDDVADRGRGRGRHALVPAEVGGEDAVGPGRRRDRRGAHAVVERVGARAAVDHDRREDVVADREVVVAALAAQADGRAQLVGVQRVVAVAAADGDDRAGVVGQRLVARGRGVEVRVAGEVEVPAGAQVVAHQAAVGEEPDRVRARGAVEQRRAPEEDDAGEAGVSGCRNGESGERGDERDPLRHRGLVTITRLWTSPTTSAASSRSSCRTGAPGRSSPWPGPTPRRSHARATQASCICGAVRARSSGTREQRPATRNACAP